MNSDRSHHDEMQYSKNMIKRLNYYDFGYDPDY